MSPSLDPSTPINSPSFIQDLGYHSGNSDNETLSNFHPKKTFKNLELGCFWLNVGAFKSYWSFYWSTFQLYCICCLNNEGWKDTFVKPFKTTVKFLHFLNETMSFVKDPISAKSPPTKFTKFNLLAGTAQLGMNTYIFLLCF